MKFNVDASNPLLVGAIQLLRAEDTPEHRKLFSDELSKAQLLSPVFIEPAPLVDENGVTTVEKGAKIQFPILNANDGKKFYVAYTDVKSLKEAADSQGNATPEVYRANYASLGLDEFGALFAAPGPENAQNPINGIVINPFNENLVIVKDMAISLFKQKMDLIKSNIDKMKDNQ
ncbi:MAG: SseB family protein [Lachnospiraceae bacterium]|nr:SseB family protein [Lachnospiraceae bacterium]